VLVEDPAMSESRDQEAPLRVAMVSRRVHPAHGPGGLERHVFELVRNLAGRGVEIDLFSETPSDGQKAQMLVSSLPGNAVVHWVPGRWLPIGDRRGTVVMDRITNYPAWALRVWRWMTRVAATEGGSPRWTLAHVHGMAGWGLARAAQKNRIVFPLLLTTQGFEEFRAPGLLKHLAYAPFRAAVRTVAAASAAVVTTDKALQPLVAQHLGIPPAEQIVIPNAVNAEECRQMADPERGRAILEELGLSGAVPLFLSVGRIAPNKGFGLLAAAFAKVGARLPESWAWLLVGDGPDRYRVEAVVASAGLEGRCRLAGSLPDSDMHSLYAVADWFVHPTQYEGSSIVTLEAMAHGLPVIATRTGGLPDKVVDGVTGRLVEPGSAGDLAAALEWASGADSASLGRAGQELCQERFSWSAAGHQYLDLYRTLAVR
jgi:glycosyltransferase involved in cell wall biosynthesis